VEWSDITRDKRKMGRPPYKTHRVVLEEVFNLLPTDGTPRQYKEVKAQAKKSGLSFRQLTKCLPELERNAQVMREVDETARPPTVYYRRCIDDFFIEGRDFYQAVVLDEDNDLGKILQEEDPAERFKKLSSRLFLELTTMTALIKRILEQCSRGMLPEEAEEYVDVVFKVHLFPWVKRLAEAACRPDGPNKLELDTALDPLRLLHEKPFLEWVEEYRRTQKLPSLEETYKILGLRGDAAASSARRRR
jgi:hypothetical protein